MNKRMAKKNFVRTSFWLNNELRNEVRESGRVIAAAKAKLENSEITDNDKAESDRIFFVSFCMIVKCK